MEKFDLIVIGSGSGLDVANAAAQRGLKVAIIERDRMGGTCLNRGCIPSKLLIHSADVMEIIQTAKAFGINVEKVTVDFERIVQRTNGIIDTDSEQIRNAFGEIENPRLFPHQCRFVDNKVISVGDETVAADRILIATGTRPGIPKISGLEDGVYITSDEALRLAKQPKVLTIMGGGYIAAELAHFFGSLGTEINIIQRRNVLLRDEDEEVSAKFTEIFSRKYNVCLGCHVESVSKKNDQISVRTKNSSGQVLELQSDQLLVAAGRIPNSDTLDLAKTGVQVDRDGFIVVDQYLETSVKGIFALGDAVGRYPFKHSANLEAQYAFNNIVLPERKVAVDYTAMPHAVFSSPQVAGAGYTEQELREKGIHYTKSSYQYKDTAMGEAIEDREGFVKLLVSPHDRKILGCHILGSHASVLIHEVLVAMRAGLSVDSIARTVHIHPALSEVVARAAYALE